MKLAPVNGVNVRELSFVSQMDVFSTCFNFWTIYYMGCNAVGISYKHYRYCHLMTSANSFVALTSRSLSSNHIPNVFMLYLHSVLHRPIAQNGSAELSLAQQCCSYRHCTTRKIVPAYWRLWESLSVMLYQRHACFILHILNSWHNPST